MKMVRIYRSQYGFTLTELIVTIAIIAIITSVAFPYVQEQLSQAEQQRLVLELKSIIRQGRHQAMALRQRLVLCGSSDGIHCGDETSWQQGWLLFNDQSRDRIRQDTEAIIYSRSLELKYGQLTWRGFGVANHLLFNPETGLMLGSNGTLTYCSSIPQHSRKVVVSYMGHTYSEQVSC